MLLNFFFSLKKNLLLIEFLLVKVAKMFQACSMLYLCSKENGDTKKSS